MQAFKYHAFISYSHEDEEVAARLQRALEVYRAPVHRRETFPKGLKPIFRDTTELTAHHSLSDKIQEAVRSSRYLIILCSKASKNSHWVNEEIKLFRRLHGDASILCCLIEGTPDTSFPPALTEDGREPLAANLSKKNFRLGTTQIAASLFEVGLDDLVQRDLKRLRRRVTAVTVGALAAMLVMGTLTWIAMDARQLAEKRTHDAEEQIEFMLTDLKDKLDEVGRLDALQIVGDNAAAYYDGYPLSDHSDDALGRRARVFQFLGNVHDTSGNLNLADEYFQKAFDSTEALLARNPNDPDQVWNHAQSVYGLGYRQRQRQNFRKAKTYFQEYLNLAMRLEMLEGQDSEHARLELSYAYTNMGAVELNLANIQEAKANYERALSYKKALFEQTPEDKKRLISIANSYAHMATIEMSDGDLDNVEVNWLRADEYILNYSSDRQDDATLLYKNLFHARNLGRLYLLKNDFLAVERQISRGKKIAGELKALEQNNLRASYENLLLDVLEFELKFLNGNFEDAKIIQNKVSSEVENLPRSAIDGRRYKTLRSIEQNLPIYLMMASEEKGDELLEHVEARKKELINAGVVNAKALQVSPYDLSAVLIVNHILNDEYSETLLQNFCSLDGISIGLNRSVQLGVKFTPLDCPNMHVTTSIYPSALSLAMQKLAQKESRSVKP